MKDKKSLCLCPCPCISVHVLVSILMSCVHVNGSCPWVISKELVHEPYKSVMFHGSSPLVMPRCHAHGSVLSIGQAKFVLKLTVYNLQKIVTFHVYTWERHAFPQYIMRKVLTFCSIINGKFPLFHEYLSKIWKYFVCLSWTY